MLFMDCTPLDDFKDHNAACNNCWDRESIPFMQLETSGRVFCWLSDVNLNRPAFFQKLKGF